VLRNVNTGAFEVTTSWEPSVWVRLVWIGRSAASPSILRPDQLGPGRLKSGCPLVQAMAGFGGGSGAADMNSAFEISHQPLLTMPHAGNHGG
jgi:hypothetical protein